MLGWNEEYNSAVPFPHYAVFKDVVTFQHKLAWQAHWLLINS